MMTGVFRLRNSSGKGRYTYFRRSINADVINRIFISDVNILSGSADIRLNENG